jgi:catechol 2,3-dioxygenase-like lactoylglutathione lyase family enzyme
VTPDPLDALRLPVVPVEPRPEFASALRRRVAGLARTTGPERPAAAIRYFVRDVQAAVDFYREGLGFESAMPPTPHFALLARGDLRLMLTTVGGPGGGQPLPDGRAPEPGGWSRIALQVADLEAAIEALRAREARFLTGIVHGIGVRLVVLEDPSGNPVELFEPAGA